MFVSRSYFQAFFSLIRFLNVRSLLLFIVLSIFSIFLDLWSYGTLAALLVGAIDQSGNAVFGPAFQIYADALFEMHIESAIAILIILFAVRFILIVSSQVYVSYFAEQSQVIIRQKFIESYLRDSFQSDMDDSDFTYAVTQLACRFSATLALWMKMLGSSIQLMIYLATSLVFVSIEFLISGIVIVLLLAVFHKYQVVPRSILLGKQRNLFRSELLEISKQIPKGRCEVKVFHWENFITRKVRELSQRDAKAAVSLQIITVGSKTFYESVILCGLAIFIIWVSQFSGSISEATTLIPLLIVLAKGYQAAIQVADYFGRIATDMDSILRLSKYNFDGLRSNINDREQIKADSLSSFSLLTKIESFLKDSGKSSTPKIIVIKAPSGFGKTTAIRNCALFFSKLGLEVGYVAQNPTIFPFTVTENVMGQVKDNKEIKLSTVLKGLGLSSFSNELNSRILKKCEDSVSGGEQKRLGIARMLSAGGYDLVFLDEPTSGLDLTSIDLVKNQVFDLSAQLIVVATHDNFLDSNADEILYLDQTE